MERSDGRHVSKGMVITRAHDATHNQNPRSNWHTYLLADESLAARLSTFPSLSLDLDLTRGTGIGRPSFASAR